MTQWVKGQSGNANGRPRGAESNSSHVRKLLQTRSEELINKVIELSLEGDITALKICIDRICPPLKSTDQIMPIQIPADVNLSQFGEHILQELSLGQISPNEAASILGTLTKQANLCQFTDLEKRLEILESYYEKK